jgi:ABC-type bacteriocin/lantibiotic exporter with double-glycine peptidase domain
MSRDATREELDLDSTLWNLDSIGMNLSYRPEITIFGAKEWLVNRYSSLLDLVTKVREEGKLQSHQPQDQFRENLYPLLQGGARALMYLAVAFKPDHFQMSIPQVTFLETSVADLISTFTSLSHLLSTRLIQDMFRIRNLLECMEEKEENADSANYVPYVPNPKGMKVELKGVSFRYHQTSPPVLKNVSFTIQPGEIVSIVGYNGSGTESTLQSLTDSGKTTLVRLLTMIDKPTEGEIHVNDHKMSDYNPKVLFANMSVLFQDFRMSSPLLI